MITTLWSPILPWNLRLACDVQGFKPISRFFFERSIWPKSDNLTHLVLGSRFYEIKCSK